MTMHSKNNVNKCRWFVSATTKYHILILRDATFHTLFLFCALPHNLHLSKNHNLNYSTVNYYIPLSVENNITMKSHEQGLITQMHSNTYTN